ncbi:MAG: 2-oxo acid dehydrogenase subunit E2 [Candidatus Thermoplasmatota archaeon]|nr:2-oxo acid dehydrogenase subunit E2 [Candidatus Thermoplasmatota archaeon]
MYSFKLPDIGEGVSEGEIVKWHVREGDHVSRDQEMVEVMTDKVTVKIPSPVEGKVSKILFSEGQVVKVGSEMILIDNGETSEPSSEQSSSPSRKETQAGSESIPAAASQHPGAGRILASPAVRRIAREKGIDLSTIAGSAENGRITLDDVERFIETVAETGETKPPLHREEKAVPAARPALDMPVTQDEILEPRGLRRLIFEKMTKSKQIIPHFTVVEEVDVTRIAGIISQLASMGTKLTYTSFFIKASTVALKEFPYLNAIYNETAHNYTLKKTYNIGMAVDTPNGLTVPVIMNADMKSLVQIAAEISDLASRARSSDLKLAEVQNSTFTVTNIGSIGGLISTPIINYPEVAILGVHRTRKVSDAAGTRDMTYISLSCDHRLIDGAMATRFLVRLKEILEKPEYFLVR